MGVFRKYSTKQGTVPSGVRPRVVSLWRKGERGPGVRAAPTRVRALGKKIKSRRRPTLARAGPALPSAKEPLTSVFGMGTGMATPPWPPAEKPWSGAKENRDAPGGGRSAFK